MQKITPFLWFQKDAKTAVEFYLSIFPDSKLVTNQKIDDSAPGIPDQMIYQIDLLGTRFTFLLGGPQERFIFSPATSFMIDCETQEEVDHYWNALSEGGKPSQCGWLDDQFGVTWQVVPSILPKLIAGPDQEKSKRAMQAMLKMQKLDIATLQAAYDGAS